MTASNIRRFAEYLRTVPDDKFDMNVYIGMNGVTGTRAERNERTGRFMSVNDYLDEPFLLSSVKLIGYGCVTAACVAGWAAMHAEQVDGRVDLPSQIELCAREYLCEGVEDARRGELQAALRDLFHDFDGVASPNDAADQLEKLAAEYGL